MPILYLTMDLLMMALLYALRFDSITMPSFTLTFVKLCSVWRDAQTLHVPP